MASFIVGSAINTVIAKMTSPTTPEYTTAASNSGGKYKPPASTKAGNMNGASEEPKTFLLPLRQLQPYATAIAQMMGDTDISDHDAVRKFCSRMRPNTWADISAALVMGHQEITISLEDLRNLESKGFSSLVSSARPITSDDECSPTSSRRSSVHSSVSSNATTLVDAPNKIPEWAQKIDLIAEAVAAKPAGGLKVTTGFITYNGKDVGVTHKFHEKRLKEDAEDYEDTIETLKVDHEDEVTALAAKHTTAMAAVKKMAAREKKLRENGKAKILDQESRIMDQQSIITRLTITEVAQKEELNDLMGENERLQADNTQKDIMIRTLQQKLQESQSEAARHAAASANHLNESQNLGRALAEERNHNALLTQHAVTNNGNRTARNLIKYYRQRYIASEEQQRMNGEQAQRELRDVTAKLFSANRDVRQLENVNANSFRLLTEEKEKSKALKDMFHKVKTENKELKHMDDLYRKQIAPRPHSVDHVYKTLNYYSERLLSPSMDTSLRQTITELIELFKENLPEFEAYKAAVDNHAGLLLNTADYREKILALEETIERQAEEIDDANNKNDDLETKLEHEKTEVKKLNDEMGKVVVDLNKERESRQEFANRASTLQEAVLRFQRQQSENWMIAAPREWEERLRRANATADYFRFRFEEVNRTNQELTAQIAANADAVENEEWLTDRLSTMEHHYRVVLSENNKNKARLGEEVTAVGVFGITPLEATFMARVPIPEQEWVNLDNVPDVKEEDLRGEFMDRSTAIDREPTNTEKIACGSLSFVACFAKAILNDDPLPHRGPAGVSLDHSESDEQGPESNTEEGPESDSHTESDAESDSSEVTATPGLPLSTHQGANGTQEGNADPEDFDFDKTPPGSPVVSPQGSDGTPESNVDSNLELKQ